MNKKKFLQSRNKRKDICRELVRYGKIIIDVQYEKYNNYFRKMLIKYNNYIYEIHLINGDCAIIKNLLT